MSKYVIELPHTDAECLQAMDEIAGKGSKLLPKVYWGCKAGVHNGWAIVDANTESEVREMIGSPLMQGRARITKVETYTEKDIAAFHKMKK